MKIHIYIRLFLAMIAVSLSSGAIAQSISFSPTRLFFKGNPGETVTQTITIYNGDTKPFEFVTNIQDWKRDTLGEKIYAPAGTLPNSNAATIKLSSTSLSIAPGEKKAFTLSMVIPREQKTDVKTSNSMLFFTQTNAQASTNHESGGIGIRISFEFAIQLFYTPDEAQAGELNFLKFEQQPVTADGKKAERLAVKFVNTGEINKDGQIRFELTNKETGEEVKLQPVPIATMPGDLQWAYCPLPVSLPKGSYLAVAILDAGENGHIKVAEKEFNIKK